MQREDVIIRDPAHLVRLLEHPEELKRERTRTSAAEHQNITRLRPSSDLFTVEDTTKKVPCKSLHLWKIHRRICFCLFFERKPFLAVNDVALPPVGNLISLDVSRGAWLRTCTLMHSK